MSKLPNISNIGRQILSVTKRMKALYPTDEIELAERVDDDFQNESDDLRGRINKSIIRNAKRMMNENVNPKDDK